MKSKTNLTEILHDSDKKQLKVHFITVSENNNNSIGALFQEHALDNDIPLFNIEVRRHHRLYSITLK